jgi:hypothetical protein
LGVVHERILHINGRPKIAKRRPWLAYSITEFIRMYQEPCNLGQAGGLPAPNSFGTRSVKTFVSVLAYVVATCASAAERGNILRKASPIITQRRLLSQAQLNGAALE